MKTGFTKYFGALLFVSLFLIKGMLVVLPVFFSMGHFETKQFLLTDSEPEENKKNAEQKIENEGTENYVSSRITSHELDAHISVLLKYLTASNERYNNNVYLPVITPPPEFLQNA